MIYFFRLPHRIRAEFRIIKRNFIAVGTLSRWLLYSAGMFNEITLEHFRNPHNAGDLPEATATVDVTNPVCGDILRLAVRIENGRVAAARFKTQGCVAAISCSSILTDLLIGRTLDESGGITGQTISDSLGGLPPATFHAAQLCAEGVAALLRKLKPE